MSGLVKFLRYLHGAGRGIAQARTGSLLEGGSSEGRAGDSFLFGFFHFADQPSSLTTHFHYFLYQFFIPWFLAASESKFIPARLATRSVAGRFLWCLKKSEYFPVFLRYESANLAFAFHNDTKRRGLHPSGGKAIADFFPNETGEVVTHQAVEYSASFLGSAQIRVNFPWVQERFF